MHTTIFSRLLALLALLAIFLLSAGLAPEPDPAPKRWELDVKIGPLRKAVVELPTGPAVFYYLTYRVTNHSATDLLFAPSFDMGTDVGEVIRAGRDVPAQATRDILDRLRDPLIQDSISILGTILRGRENAKDGIAIWRAGHLNVNEIAIYAHGFSGETRVIETIDPVTGELRPVTLRKTYMVRYRTPGMQEGRGSEPFEPYESRWIMR